jgi:peptidoglycan/LPS O-acetylase OafA/YrhL
MGARDKKADRGELVRRLTALDGLRTVAVLLVFAHHVDQRALPGGFIGVDVFFVISGYLITSLLLREREMTGDISVSRFYLRRALRLYPALLVMVLVLTPIAAVDHIGWPVPDALAALSYVTDFWSNVFGHLTLLLHTWSLSVEEQFYLVWPAVLLFMLRRNLPLRLILIGLAAISVLITYAASTVPTIHHHVVIQYLPTSHLAELVAGILLAVGELHEPKRWLVRLGGLPVALVALGALVVAEFTLSAHWWWAFPLATIACWPPVAHLVLHRESWISAALRFPPVVWLGRRSYAFYLWHYPIILLLHRQPALTRWEIAAIALPLTLAITAVSWRLVETPFLRLKARFERYPADSAASRNEPVKS